MTAQKKAIKAVILLVATMAIIYFFMMYATDDSVDNISVMASMMFGIFIAYMVYKSHKALEDLKK